MKDNIVFPPLTPLAHSPDDAARIMGIGRTKLYALLKEGELKSIKIGSRRLITTQAIHDYFITKQEGISHGY